MSLPIALLAGFLVAFLDQQWTSSLPGSGTWERVVPTLLLLALPTVLATWSLRLARRELVLGRAGRVPPRAALVWSAFATPMVVHLLFFAGAFGDVIERVAWDDEALGLVLTLLPAFVAELPRLVVAVVAQTHVEILGQVRQPIPVAALPHLRDLAPLLRLRLGWPILIAGLVAMLVTLLFVLQASRELLVLAMVTTPGTLVMSLVLLLLAVCLLPPLFRVAFGVRADLPEPTGTALRATAQSLGFAPSRVLLLPTGKRSLNAMLVGPLPFGRFLCITDGLLEALDVDALRGVVAHEIGHARRGHPAWLMALAVSGSLLALATMRCVAQAELPIEAQVVVAVVVVAVVWLLVRQLAHRVELEADAASVVALGAGPCSQALLDVAKLAAPVGRSWVHHLFTLHPDELRRAQRMHRYQGDPEYRAAFEARGVWLRAAVLVLLLAAPVALWSVMRDSWAFEHVVWRLHSGDVAAARQLATEVEPVSAELQDAWKSTQALLAAAVELAPDAHDWASASPRFAANGWARGEQVLLTRGPAAARPWFALALAADPTPTDVERAVYAFCAAAADEQPERMEECKLQVRRLGIPASLRPVFAE